MDKKTLIRLQSIVTVLVSIVTITYFISEYFFDLKSTSSSLVLIAGMVSVLFLTLFLYLQRSSNDEQIESRLSRKEFEELKYIIKHDFRSILGSTTTSSDEINALNKKIDETNSIFSKIDPRNIQLNEDDKKQILNEFKKKINSDFTSDIIESFEEKYSTFNLKKELIEALSDEFSEVKRRLFSEVNKLSSRANLNLAIGATSSIIAIAILGITIWVKPTEFQETSDLISYLIPRVSLVIFIELFAFFFLKLYKTTLGDIKYYQNETTNIDLKLLALKTAIIGDDTESIKLILSELSKTERNFKLDKGQTTIELERLKGSENSNNQLIELLKSIINTKEKSA